MAAGAAALCDGKFGSVTVHAEVQTNATGLLKFVDGLTLSAALTLQHQWRLCMYTAGVKPRIEEIANALLTRHGSKPTSLQIVARFWRFSRIGLRARLCDDVDALVALQQCPTDNVGATDAMFTIFIGDVLRKVFCNG